MQNLVPRELKDYYYSGAINPSSSDSKIQLAENMLINIDELQGMRSGAMENLKALITDKEVKTRRPYARVHEPHPHRASFVGSANSTDFLSDVTGNRRFLPFEVTSIDNSGVVSMDNVYAQAKHLFNNGFRHWFNQDEIAMINVNNEAFKTSSMEEDTLLKCIEPCDENDEKVQFGTTTEIMNILISYAPIRVNNGSIQRLGRLLKNKYRFKNVKRGNVHGYFYKNKKTIPGYIPEKE
jgi:predicted P-loop ATPase